MKSKREEDKEQLNSLLSLLTTKNTNGEYSLKKEIYLSKELNADWPFYSSFDSNIVKQFCFLIIFLFFF